MPQLWKNGTGFGFSEPRLAATDNGATLGRKRGAVVRIQGRSSAFAAIRKEPLLMCRLASEMAESKGNHVKQTSVTFTKAACREPRLLVRSTGSADHRGVSCPGQRCASPRRPTVLGGRGHPSNNQGGHSAGRTWWILVPRSSACGSTIPECSWGACLMSPSADAQETDLERAGCCGNGCDQVRMNCTSSRIFCSNPEVPGWSESMQVPLCLG